MRLEPGSNEIHRGPAKGYLSDLEMKLHQMEALIGVLLASNDPRAVSLVADISQDSAARDILQRVDNSAVGTRNISQDANARSGMASVGKRIATELADSTQEWQSHLSTIITNRGLGQVADGKLVPPVTRNSLYLLSSGRTWTKYIFSACSEYHIPRVTSIEPNDT